MSDDLELQGWFYVGCGPREIGHYVWEHTGIFRTMEYEADQRLASPSVTEQEKPK